MAVEGSGLVMTDRGVRRRWRGCAKRRKGHVCHLRLRMEQGRRIGLAPTRQTVRHMLLEWGEASASRFERGGRRRVSARVVRFEATLIRKEPRRRIDRVGREGSASRVER